MKNWAQICLFFCLVLWASFSWGAEVRIAVFPFEIHAPKDLSYVREGIQDMLSTRLCVPGKTIIIDEVKVRQALSSLKGPLTEAKAKEIGQKLGADYVLYGSVTTFGQKASLDAKLIAVNTSKPPLALYTNTNTLDDFIPKLADFAYQALSYIEGAPVSPVQVASRAPAPARAPLQAPVPPGAQNVPPSSFQALQTVPSSQPMATAIPTPPPESPTKMHPERIIREQASNYQASPPSAPAPQAPTQAQAQAQAQTQAQQQARASKYRYSDIDPWPDYPPEEEDLAPIVEEPAPKAPKKKKKKSFWSKLWPGNWFGGKKEEEVVLSPEGSVPPPPPPPQAPQGQRYPSSPTPSPSSPAPQAQNQVGSPQGYNPPPAPQAPSTPPPSQGTWQWY